ncbi:hypothetical protein WJX72_003477 [[Myrmecia] bisecta]|uniref:Uncharacterized protein n=1 Tax=[Myrmecia] bisecta TaxID=41462 RepID=A0AAW1R5F0_9CHLO
MLLHHQPRSQACWTARSVQAFRHTALPHSLISFHNSKHQQRRNYQPNHTCQRYMRVCRSSASAFGLSEDQAPGLLRLAAKLEVFPVMQRLQAEILHEIKDGIAAVAMPTRLAQDGMHIYNSPDGDATVVVEVSKGRQVEWLVASCTALVAMDVGTVRINAFPDSTTRIPKLDIELFHFFGKVAMYVNLLPRANLVLNEEYLERYYKTKMGPKAREWHDLELACMADPAFQPYKTRSQDMRVVTGQTGLFYMADASVANTQKCGEYAREATAIWLELLQQADGLVTDPAEAEQLAAFDAKLYEFIRKDPDNEKVVALFGEQAVQQMVQLGSRDSAIVL